MANYIGTNMYTGRRYCTRNYLQLYGLLRDEGVVELDVELVRYRHCGSENDLEFSCAPVPDGVGDVPPGRLHGHGEHALPGAARVDQQAVGLTFERGE